MANSTFIISLGGSIIVPATGIDINFLKKFRNLILSRLKKGDKFLIITGGGSTCRQYNHAVSRIVKTDNEDLDWLGIAATKLNAELLRIIFKKEVYHEIISNPKEKIQTAKKLIIGSGWKPGSSSDLVAVLMAKKFGIKKIINLSNIDFAYDKDPGKFKDAKKLEKINWAGFKKIVGKRWIPGLNAPFDPTASRIAAGLKLEVIIMNGHNLKNLNYYLSGKKFLGTVIK